MPIALTDRLAALLRDAARRHGRADIMAAIDVACIDPTAPRYRVLAGLLRSISDQEVVALVEMVDRLCDEFARPVPPPGSAGASERSRRTAFVTGRDQTAAPPNRIVVVSASRPPAPPPAPSPPLLPHVRAQRVEQATPINITTTRRRGGG